MADGEDMETVFSFMEDCKKNHTLTHFADRKMPVMTYAGFGAEVLHNHGN